MNECLGEEVLQSYLDGELPGGELQNVTSHLASCVTCSTLTEKLEWENNLLAAALAPEFETCVPTERLRQRIDAAMAAESSINEGGRGLSTVPRFGSWLQFVSGIFTVAPQRAFGYAGLMAVVIFAVILAVVQRRNFQSPPRSHEVATVLESGADGLRTGSTPDPISLTPPSKIANTVVSPSRRPRNFSARAPIFRNPATAAHHVKLLPGERSYLQTIAELDSTIKLDRGGMKPALQAEYERNLAFVDRALAAARTAAKNNPNDPDAAEFMFSAYQSKVDLLNTVADARVYDKQH